MYLEMSSSTSNIQPPYSTFAPQSLHQTNNYTVSPPPLQPHVLRCVHVYTRSIAGTIILALIALVITAGNISVIVYDTVTVSVIVVSSL